MTRLQDYMRAEVPDENEPASFYVPGANDWREAKLRRSKLQIGGTREDRVEAETPLDTNDIDQETAAAREAAAHQALEG